MGEVWIALAVMIDGMLAVSAECGCCHHSIFNVWLSMPFHLDLAFSFGLPLFSYFWFVLSNIFVYNITWCLVYFFYMVYVLQGLWVLFWWGVLFCCICTTTYVYFPVVLMSYIPFLIFFLFLLLVIFCVPFASCISSPGFACSYLCDFLPQLDENFWGVCAYAFSICSYMCILR